MYDLVEIFESMQGEGRNTGRPCVFVRFAGCNLSCPWCDTDVARRFSMPLDELVAEVSSFRPRSVVLTGGEPTLAAGMPELVAALKERGFWIAVETNGTSAPDWLAFVDYVACSPKRGAPLALDAADEVRVVCDQNEAWVEVDGVKGETVPVSGDLFYPLYTAVGAGNAPMEFFAGRIKGLSIDLR